MSNDICKLFQSAGTALMGMESNVMMEITIMEMAAMPLAELRLASLVHLLEHVLQFVEMASWWEQRLVMMGTLLMV